MIFKPRRESIEPVLFESSPHDGVASVGASDDEGEDEENEQKADQKSHTEEVKSEKALSVPVGADEAG